jgi:hypothetical protein
MRYIAAEMVFFPADVCERHTLHNLLDTGYFVTLNHVQTSFYRQAHQTSARYQTSEFEACEANTLYSLLCSGYSICGMKRPSGLAHSEKE